MTIAAEREKSGRNGLRPLRPGRALPGVAGERCRQLAAWSSRLGHKKDKGTKSILFFGMQCDKEDKLGTVIPRITIFLAQPILPVNQNLLSRCRISGAKDSPRGYSPDGRLGSVGRRAGVPDSPIPPDSVSPGRAEFGMLYPDAT